MRKIKVLFFLTFLMIAFATYQAKAIDFVPYEMIDGTGTFAETTKRIQVAFDSKTNVDMVFDELILTVDGGDEVGFYRRDHRTK